MRVSDYSIAVQELLTSGKDFDSTMCGLRAVLVAHGHMRLYTRILRNLLAHYKKRKKLVTTTLSFARTQDEMLWEGEIMKLIKLLGGSEVTTVINPRIIGGFVAEGRSARIDRSYKKQLLTLYRSLIS